MPIYSPTGFLDITNATLRTSNTECQNLKIGTGNLYVTSEISPDYILNLSNVTNLGATSPHTLTLSNVTTAIDATSNIITSGNLKIGGLIYTKDWGIRSASGSNDLYVGRFTVHGITEVLITDQGASLGSASKYTITRNVNSTPLVNGIDSSSTIDYQWYFTSHDSTTYDLWVRPSAAVQTNIKVTSSTYIEVDEPTGVTLIPCVNGLINMSGNVVANQNLTVSSNLTVSGNATVSTDLTVSGNTFYTNPVSINVDSNVVTEYTGPHDRPLRKYPEVALTANDNSSTSGYVADQSSTNGFGDGLAYRLFDHSSTTAYQSGGAFSGGIATGSNPITTASDESTHQGVAITLDLATKIRLSYAKITSHTYYGRTPANGSFLGSNNNSTWDVIGTFSGLSTTAAGQTHTVHIADYATKSAYRYIRLVVTRTSDSLNLLNGGTLLEFRELEYYGYEEGSGSLDTTLKSVYNVPATTETQLEVYYDAKDLTTMPSTVTDLSPNSNGGSVTGATLDTTDGIESFKFATSSSQYIEKVFSGYTQSTEYSASVWFKSNSYTADSYIFQLGLGDHSNGSGIGMNIESEGPLRAYIYGYGSSSQVSTSVDTIATNNWYHATATYYSSGKNELYINGVLVGEGKATQLGTINASAPLTLGTYYQSSQRNTPSFNGSIANFRLYSKALNADQVKELYDYQKDYFLGSKSQVTLYKGHLGVGVTEPSGQLELAGDERIQEYPPGPMSNYDTNIPGHGVFTASASSYYTSSNFGWFPFDKNATTKWASENLQNYNGTGQAYSASRQLGSDTSKGEYVILKFPYKIKLKSTKIQTHTPSSEAVEDFIIYGSNDGNTWSPIFTKTGDVYNSSGTYHDVNSVDFYDRFAIVCTRTNGSTHIFALTEWRLFGTPGPTTLDKGSLTLGRSLDVPRVSRYDVDTETPRPEKLVLDFDTTVNSTPTDISGRGNHGTFNGTNMKYSPADKAFVFNGSDDYLDIPSVSGVGTGAWVHSKSFWFKLHSSTDAGVIFLLGRNGGTKQIAVQSNGSGQFQYYIYGCSSKVQVNGSDWFPDVNRWYHCVTVFKNNETTATGGVITGREMYIDGVKQTLIATNTQVALNLDSSQVRFGNQFNSIYLDFELSNPKIYSVALEPSEVKKLYNLGRTGRSMVISDTAVGIGKVPEAQLDVKGNISCDGVFRSENPIAFEAYYTDGTLSTTGTYLPNYVRYNYGGCYHQDTGRFYAPINGIYAFHWHAYTNQGDSISRIFIAVNGNDYGQKGNSVQHMGQQLSFSIYLNAGDYLLIKGKSSYPLYFHGYANHNMYTGHLVIAM